MISILYPVYTGLSIVCVCFIGVYIFDEPFNSQHVIGGLLIVCGIILMS